MGTILFILLCLIKGHAALNDYQVLPLLVSLDVIGISLTMILLQLRKGKDTAGPPAGD